MYDILQLQTSFSAAEGKHYAYFDELNGPRSLYALNTTRGREILPICLVICTVLIKEFRDLHIFE